MTPIRLLTKAFDFAARKHTEQRRKGNAAEPYINHPAEVAQILGRHTNDTIAIVAGILHDTVEDTKTTYAELKKEFGRRVADVVMECTDDKSLSKAERKHLQITTSQHKSRRAKLVKIADKITNIRSVASDSPPDGWDLRRRQEYLLWAHNVMDGLRGVNRGLEREFDTVYAQGAKALGLPVPRH